MDGVSISFILAHKRFIVNNAYGRGVYHRMHKLCTKSFDQPVENYLYNVEKRLDLWPTTISLKKHGHGAVLIRFERVWLLLVVFDGGRDLAVFFQVLPEQDLVLVDLHAVFWGVQLAAEFRQ